MRAARLLARGRALHDRFRAVEHRAELERLQEIGVVDVGAVVQLEVAVAPPQLGELGTGRREALSALR